MFARLLSSIACNFYKTKWTHHLPKKHPSKPLQVPFRNWTITQGDVVKVITGDDKGKVGRVVKVFRKLNRVVVRKINMHEYTKRLQDGKTVRLKKASSVHVSNVGLFDQAVRRAVRVIIGYHPDTGQVLRISKKSGRILYRSQKVLKSLKREVRGRKRKIGLKDTPAALAHKVTYQGEDFEAIRREFEQFIAAKQAREKLLVFKE